MLCLFIPIISGLKEQTEDKSKIMSTLESHGDHFLTVYFQVKPPAQPKAKYVTPYNRLVGAVMVTQMRKKQGACDVSNSFVKSYVKASGTTCQMIEVSLKSRCMTNLFWC